MCHLFAGQPPGKYASQTRSLRLGGHSTSVRLEAAFWRILEEIAELQGVSLGKLLTTLHDEILELRGENTNFASLLRCACLTYVEEAKGREVAISNSRAEAARKFDALQAAE